jgi:hypothetical protein
MAKLSKSNEAGIKNARQHLRLGNDGAYVRSMAGLHRAASAAQAKLIWEEVVRDRMELRFRRVPSIFSTFDRPSYSLVEAQDDPELVTLEMAA